jgi:ectoine hydroxylase
MTQTAVAAVTKTQNATEDLYPSRVHDQPQLIDRKDPVVWGDPGHLTAVHRRSYETNGFLVLERFFSPEELKTFQQEAQRLRDSDALKGREEVITEPSSDEVRSIFAPHRLSPLIERLSRDRRILAVVEELLGSQAYIFQGRINYKPGFRGKEFYWHSDFETWHVEDGMPRMRAVSCSISLTDNVESNGPLMLIPGSHRQFLSCVGQTPEDHYKESLKKQEYGVPDETSLARMADEGGIFTAEGPAGSVTFFECNTMHGSNSNITPWPRSNIFLVYNSVENELVDPYCGLKPRPDFIANRSDPSPLTAS